MKHPLNIEGYTLEELAENIGDLRYDRLQEFLGLLGDKIDRDADKDSDNGRIKLPGVLNDLEHYLNEASKSAKEAWRISEPYMKNNSQ